MIVRTAGDESLVQRVRAELSGGAFSVLEVAPEPGTLDAELAALAAAHSADAALRVRKVPSEVELWTARPVGDPNGTLDVITEDGSAAHDEEVLVLRVVETLRALGLGRVLAPAPEAAPIAPATAPSPAQAQATEEEPVVDEPERSPAAVPRLWIELAPALALSAGGLGPQLQALLGVRWQPFQLVSIAGFAFAPLWRPAIEADEGKAQVSTWLLGAAVDAHYRVAPLELSAGVGLASVITQMSGSTSAQLDPVDETDLTAAPIVRAGIHLALGSGLRVCTRVLAGVSIPEVSTRFDEREVAHWGQPFVTVSVGLELGLMGAVSSD